MIYRVFITITYKIINSTYLTPLYLSNPHKERLFISVKCLAPKVSWNYINFELQFNLIWTSTPAGNSSFIKASTVLSLGFRISITLLWVVSSYWSLASLFTWGDIRTVNLSLAVGRGIGPETVEPVLLAVSTISSVDASISLWSNDLSLILIVWLLSQLKPEWRYSHHYL